MVTSLLRHFDEVGLLWADGRYPSVKFRPSVKFCPSVELRISVERLKMTLGARAAPIYNFFLKRTSVEVFTNPRSRFQYLDRGLINTSTEGWRKPRSRALLTLGRGIKTSVEGLRKPRSRYVFLVLPKSACQKVLPRSMDSPFVMYMQMWDHNG